MFIAASDLSTVSIAMFEDQRQRRTSLEDRTSSIRKIGVLREFYSSDSSIIQQWGASSCTHENQDDENSISSGNKAEVMVAFI